MASSSAAVGHGRSNTFGEWNAVNSEDFLLRSDARLTRRARSRRGRSDARIASIRAMRSLPLGGARGAHDGPQPRQGLESKGGERRRIFTLFGSAETRRRGVERGDA